MSDDARRSAGWFADDGKNGFIARHHMRQIGLAREDLARPIIGIANSWSELTPCNAHLRAVAEHVKRGVTASGGTALEFPVMSLGEPLMRPTTMFYRNLMAMEVEETVRANPLDAVVLLGGCDKTTPALLMGAASVDIPTIVLTGGPMLNGRYRGTRVGSGTDIWRMSEGRRSGTVTDRDFDEFEACLARSAGHCMTMGTASTMACLVEAMGLQLPGAASLPAVDARRSVLARQTGARAVALAEGGVRLSSLLTRNAFENAIVVNAAIGGSTNAVLHLLAIAGRAGVPLDLDDFDRLGAVIPLLVDLMPSGRFLMEEFAEAGGVQAVVEALGDHLHRDVRCVDGLTVGERAHGTPIVDPEVIRSLATPVLPAGSATVVLRGNVCPGGAVLKPSAADPNLLRHTGPALVYDSLDEYLAVAEDDDRPVTAGTVLVVRNLGPRGYPGMPELGNFPLPKRLLDAGVTDMVRISDARMSGTAFGTVVLHVAPEAAVGGPLALVQTGDTVILDVAARELRIDVSDQELDERRTRWRPPGKTALRGWARLYAAHVMQADRGVDLDFLHGCTPASSVARAF